MGRRGLCAAAVHAACESGRAHQLLLLPRGTVSDSQSYQITNLLRGTSRVVVPVRDSDLRIAQHPAGITHPSMAAHSLDPSACRVFYRPPNRPLVLLSSPFVNARLAEMRLRPFPTHCGPAWCANVSGAEVDAVGQIFLSILLHS